MAANANALIKPNGVDTKPGAATQGNGKDSGGGGQDFSKLVEQLSGLVKGVSDLNVNNQAALKEVLGQNQEILRAIQANKQTAPVSVEEVMDDDTLDRMPRKDLLAHITKMIERTVKGAIDGEIVPKLTALETGVANVGVSATVQSLSGKYKDFMDWLPEINAVAKRVTGMNPEEMYLFVKGANPDKAKELGEKYKGSDAATGDAQKFGGLAPGGTPQRVEKRDMTEDEAAATAWNEVIGSLDAESKKALIRTTEEAI